MVDRVILTTDDADELPQWAQTAIHFAAGVTVTCAAIAVIYTHDAHRGVDVRGEFVNHTQESPFDKMLRLRANLPSDEKIERDKAMTAKVFRVTRQALMIVDVLLHMKKVGL